MSENKPVEALLKQFNERLDKLEKSKSEPSQSTAQPTRYKPHTHSAHVEFECPECQKQYNEEIISKALSEKKEKILKMKDPSLCENCGEIYDEEETEGDCPTCGRKKYGW